MATPSAYYDHETQLYKISDGQKFILLDRHQVMGLLGTLSTRTITVTVNSKEMDELIELRESNARLRKKLEEIAGHAIFT